MPRKFSKIIAGVALCLLCASASSACFALSDSSFRNVKKSDHFIILSNSAPIGYTDEVVTRAEEYYNSITDELGFSRYAEFWTWENRAKIYLFDNREDYRKNSKQPGWSGAGVNVMKKEMVTYVDRDDFFDEILPHEMGHIVFREFIGYKRKLPLWVDEGIASFLEKKNRADKIMLASALVRTSQFMDIAELQKVKRTNMFMPQVFYAESASVIDFLLDQYGQEKFVNFCRGLQKLRDDQDWTVAFFDAYKFSDFTDLNDKWKAYLLTKPPASLKDLLNRMR